MTAPLGHDHEQAYDALAVAALGALPADERAIVEAHAALCASCGPELAAFRATVARLDEPGARPALAPARGAAVRARLVARARGAAAAPPAAARSRAALWVALAASVAAVAAGVEVVRLRADRSVLGAVAAQREAAIRSLRAALAERDEALAGVTGPGVRVVELASAGSAAPTARMFWDRRTHSWLFYAHRLPPARAGRTYQLWLVTAATKISAGTFDSSPAGDATVRARYELAADDLTGVAITDEPAGGVAAPTGEVVLVGAVTK